MSVLYKKCTALVIVLLSVTSCVITRESPNISMINDEITLVTPLKLNDLVLASSLEFVETIPGGRLTESELKSVKIDEGLESLFNEVAAGSEDFPEHINGKKVGVLQGNAMIWPTEGTLSSSFGMRNGRMHAGTDIAAPAGTPIYASATGQVIRADYWGAYGRTIVIAHKNNVQTLYSHLSRFSVKSGQSVQAGELIGYMGRTGRATGNHLHFEIRVDGGTPIDSESVLPEWDGARSGGAISKRSGGGS